MVCAGLPPCGRMVTAQPSPGEEEEDGDYEGDDHFRMVVIMAAEQ